MGMSGSWNVGCKQEKNDQNKKVVDMRQCNETGYLQ